MSMKIQVLGTGCPKCHETLARVRQVAGDLGLDAEIVEVDRIDEIMRFGVLATPAVAVDGSVVVAGKVPTVEELEALLDRREADGS